MKILKIIIISLIAVLTFSYSAIYFPCRVGSSSDGNHHDDDDKGASAFMVMIAAAAQARYVHHDYKVRQSSRDLGVINGY